MGFSPEIASGFLFFELFFVYDLRVISVAVWPMLDDCAGWLSRIGNQDIFEFFKNGVACKLILGNLLYSFCEGMRIDPGRVSEAAAYSKGSLHLGKGLWSWIVL